MGIGEYGCGPVLHRENIAVTQRYDSLQRHLALCPDLAQAVVPMGMALAWSVNLQLISPTYFGDQEQLILRIRYGELFGSELLVASGGDLEREMFNEPGQHFWDQYYANYDTDLEALFDPNAVLKGSAEEYAKIAKMLTQKYFTAQSGRSGTRANNVGFDQFA